MNDLISQVIAEAEEFILKPLGPDEVTAYMLEERDKEGRSAKIWAGVMDKLVKAGRAERHWRRRAEDNKRVIAWRLIE